MTPLNQIPSRVKYYLLDFKDTHYNRFYALFNKGALRDLTLKELSDFFDYAVRYDKTVILNEKERN